MHYSAAFCGSRLASGAAVAIIACAVVAGCSRKQEQAPPSADATTPASTPPAAQDANAWPEGVLRAYYWECDGGMTLVMKNLVRDDAITLNLHEGARKLAHVPSGSGAKYADQSIEFWIKGSAATYEHKPAPPVNCREVRAKSMSEDARARGVVYRGLGNEPGWTLEIGPDDRLSYVTDYGEARHDFTDVQMSGDAMAGGRVYQAQQGDAAISVTVKREACADDMSGAAFDHSVRVEFGGQTYRGCGDRLGPG